MITIQRRPFMNKRLVLYLQLPASMILKLILVFVTVCFISAVCRGQTSVSNSATAADIGFGSIDVRYPQTLQQNDPSVLTSQDLVLSQTVRVVAWKGEKISIQLVINALQSLKSLSAKADDLVGLQTDGTKGRIIAASAVKIGFVRSLLSNGLGSSGGGCGIEAAVQQERHIVSDGIEYTKQTDVTAHTIQPIWLSVQVPETTKEGLYKGKIDFEYSLNNENKKQLKGGLQKRVLYYTIEVKDKVLPKPANWDFHLDLWQYPEAIARVNNIKAWSSEHFDKMRPYMQMLASAGQKVITAGIIEDPWNGQTYDKYNSMIKWIKEKDGHWRYDYSVFDAWVSFMMEMGIDHQINCYSMVPWHNSFTYEDEASGAKKVLVTKPGTAEYIALWQPMLKDFAQHLRKKGWFEKTTIAMDERPLEAMMQVIKLVKSLPDPFKISLAGSYHAAIEKDIYDYSITTGESYDSLILQRRTAAKLPTTYYTCCTEGYPNTFSFSPPAEAAFIPLLSAKRKLSGYLRWAYNAWPSEPWKDARFGSWSSGDTYLVYPGPGSSIRFEQLIRGIQDFQKISLLRKALKSRNDEAGLLKLNQALNECSVKNLKTRPAAELVSSVEEVLNQ